MDAPPPPNEFQQRFMNRALTRVHSLPKVNVPFKLIFKAKFEIVLVMSGVSKMSN